MLIIKNIYAITPSSSYEKYLKEYTSFNNVNGRFNTIKLKLNIFPQRFTSFTSKYYKTSFKN